jgi:hypothetical protein
MAVMTRTAIPLALVTAAVAFPAPTAPAGNDEGSSTFEGTCDFAGALRQDPPLTNAPAEGEARARANGPCFGTWTDADGDVHELDGDVVKYFAHAQGTLSCAGGSAAGSGFLRFRGDRLAFSFSEVRGPGVAAISLKGNDGGSAGGAATVSEEEDPAEIAEKCGGEGVRKVRIRIHLAGAVSG